MRRLDVRQRAALRAEVGDRVWRDMLLEQSAMRRTWVMDKAVSALVRDVGDREASTEERLLRPVA